MEFRAFRRYKLVEFDRGMTIIDEKDSLGGRIGVKELIVADMPTICEYLIRYNENRVKGLAPQNAHDAALYGAKIINSNGIEVNPEPFALEAKK